MRPTRTVPLCCALALFATGCGVDVGYLLQLAGGTLGSVLRSRPIEEALADPNVEESIKTKLRFVQEVREFGLSEIEQTGGGAFTLYDDDREVVGSGRLVGFFLTASARDSFTPYEWSYPFVGNSSYKSYFNLMDAQRERDQLIAQGYDAYLGQIGALSTLGILPDPIHASQLVLLDEPSLAELVLHELSHSTVVKAGATKFNETLATFVGRNAGRQFYRTRRDPASTESIAAMARYDDENIIDEYVAMLFAEMSSYYASSLSSEEKLAGRQARFDEITARFDTDFRPRLANPERYGTIAGMTLNNARIFAAGLYLGNRSLYRDVLEKSGGDWTAWWQVMREAAAAPDPEVFLEDWLATH